MAYLSLRTTNLDPDNLIEVSKSIFSFFAPNSTWDLTLNENFLTSPFFFISLFDFSSFPTGTSSWAKFGREKIILSISFWLILCFFSKSKISIEIFLDFSKLDLSLDFDKDFFSCSSFSFLLIKSLFEESFLLKLSISKSVLRFSNFLKSPKFFLTLLNYASFKFSFLFFSVNRTVIMIIHKVIVKVLLDQLVL